MVHQLCWCLVILHSGFRISRSLSSSVFFERLNGGNHFSCIILVSSFLEVFVLLFHQLLVNDGFDANLWFCWGCWSHSTVYFSRDSFSCWKFCCRIFKRFSILKSLLQQWSVFFSLSLSSVSWLSFLKCMKMSVKLINPWLKSNLHRFHLTLFGTPTNFKSSDYGNWFSSVKKVPRASGF